MWFSSLRTMAVPLRVPLRAAQAGKGVCQDPQRSQNLQGPIAVLCACLHNVIRLYFASCHCRPDPKYFWLEQSCQFMWHKIRVHNDEARTL